MAMNHEWHETRGFKKYVLSVKTSTSIIEKYLSKEDNIPWWLGKPLFHDSHKSMLLKKKPEHYSQFGWNVPDIQYIWPMEEAGKVWQFKDANKKEKIYKEI